MTAGKMPDSELENNGPWLFACLTVFACMYTDWTFLTRHIWNNYGMILLFISYSVLLSVAFRLHFRVPTQNSIPSKFLSPFKSSIYNWN